MNRIALALLVVPLTVAASMAQTPPAAFELPVPTGTLPIGTTRWVVTDQSRDETFETGKKRDVEVIAWYPKEKGAQGAQGAPYLRGRMEEVLSFARLAKLGDAFNGLASVHTHATIDAEPVRSPARLPVIVFQHG